MTTIADAIRAVLVPFLLLTGATLFLLICHVLLLHATRDLVARRRQRLLAIYQPLVDAVLYDADAAEPLRRLGSAPGRHREVVARLILDPLRVAEGSLTARARDAAAAFGLIGEWRKALGHRHWWIRAEAAHALGLVRCRDEVQALVAALDDPFEEVRAAAVDALGRIADPATIPELVARLREQSRHQRVRLVHALRQFGSDAVGPLLEHARAHADDLAAVADVLGDIEAAGAIEPLLEWCGHDRPEVRVAASRAVGTIGVDDRAYYHLLRALHDDAAEVRAAAAWALGRSGREDAAAYLADRLQDQWAVAAQSARALRDLGPTGRAALETAAAAENGELARQMLWECGARARA